MLSGQQKTKSKDPKIFETFERLNERDARNVLEQQDSRVKINPYPTLSYQAKGQSLEDSLSGDKWIQTILLPP